MSDTVTLSNYISAFVASLFFVGALITARFANEALDHGGREGVWAFLFSWALSAANFWVAIIIVWRVFGAHE